MLSTGWMPAASSRHSRCGTNAWQPWCLMRSHLALVGGGDTGLRVELDSRRQQTTLATPAKADVAMTTQVDEVSTPPHATTPPSPQPLSSSPPPSPFTQLPPSPAPQLPPPPLRLCECPPPTKRASGSQADEGHWQEHPSTTYSPLQHTMTGMNGMAKAAWAGTRRAAEA